MSVRVDERRGKVVGVSRGGVGVWVGIVVWEGVVKNGWC